MSSTRVVGILLLSVTILTACSDVLKCESGALDETQHILRNYGKNVCTPESGCDFGNARDSLHTVGNIFLNQLNVDHHICSIYPQLMQINLDNRYILNTLKYWLYDKDNRAHQYKVEISGDGKTWRTVAEHENKQSWQTLEFEEQYVKHIRFIGGKNTVNNYLCLCKFYAFYDYSRAFP